MLSCYYLTKVRKGGIALKPQMTLIKSPRRHNNKMEAVITFFEEELIEQTLKTGFSAVGRNPHRGLKIQSFVISNLLTNPINLY